jgi:hypothetical protein
MKPREDAEFSWTMLFAVTSGSFFIFSLLTKLLEGSPDHAGLFFKTGLVSLGLTIISAIGRLITSPASDD